MRALRSNKMPSRDALAIAAALAFCAILTASALVALANEAGATRHASPGSSPHGTIKDPGSFR